MIQKTYVIVSANTIPLTKYTHRIIDLCLIRLNSDGISSKFSTLLNPLCLIPKSTRKLTGIDQETVRFEPVFCEIAEDILVLLKEATLVSINDGIGCRALRSEFKTIGYKLTNTVVNFSKLVSKEVSISNWLSTVSFKGSKRATEKAKVYATTFCQFLSEGIIFDDKPDVNKPARLTSSKFNLHKIDFMERKPGVYYFKNDADEIIYIGKAVRLRDRVRSHFNATSEREINLCAATAHIDFEYTGSNIIAELLEADEIKKHQPHFNIAQKKKTKPFIIVSKENKSGYLQLSIVRKDYSDSVNEVFYNRKSVAEKLMEVCARFELCPKFCGFHRIRGNCQHEISPNCPQACIGKETVGVYNARVQQALKFLQGDLKNFAIKLKGRTSSEMGFVYIRNGVYLGFGYVGPNDQVASPEDFENYILRKTHTYHTTRIIESYIRKPRNKMRLIDL